MRKILFFVLIFVTIALVIFLFFPVFQPVVMYLYISPLVSGVITISFLLFAVDFIFLPKDIRGTLTFATIVIGAVVVPFSIILQKYIVYTNFHKEIKDKFQKVSEISFLQKSLRKASSSDFRLLPGKVARKNYMISSLEYPRYTIEKVHVTTLNETLFWYAFLEPEGLINRIMLKPKGVFLIPANQSERKVIKIEREIPYSPEILFTDNLKWRLCKFDYFADYDTPRIAVKRGKVFILVPQIKYKWRFYSALPYFSGVVVIDEDGKMTKMSPEKALKEFPDIPLFPEKLAIKMVLSQNYFKDSAISNFFNLLFRHENQIEIPQDSEEQNSQPYLVISSGKPYWIFAAEPYGEAYGISRIFLIDMRGNVIVYSFREPRIGPIKGKDYIQKSLPTFDWDKFQIVEPLPVITGKTLYWKYTIIPTSGGGITKIALVNSSSGEVRVFSSPKEYKAFLYRKEKTPEQKEKGKRKKVVRIIKLVKNGNTHWIIVFSDGTYKEYSANSLPAEKIIEIESLKK